VTLPPASTALWFTGPASLLPRQQTNNRFA
jgi:hypothetical protein